MSGPDLDYIRGGADIGERRRRYFEEGRKVVEISGRMIQGVFPTRGQTGPSFYYTIGNALRGLPELLLIADLNGPTAALALNTLSERMLDDGKALDEGLVDIEWSFPFKVLNASAEAKKSYTIQVGQILPEVGEDYEVQQVLICDKHGAYPDEPECTGTIATYPVLRNS